MIKENLIIYIKRVVLFFIITLSVILQNSGKIFRDVLGTNILIVIPAIVCISMFESETMSLFYGLTGGIIWDISSADNHYYHGIILAVCAFFVSYLIRRILRNTLLTSMILTFIVCFIHNTGYWLINILIRHPEGAGNIYFSFYFLSCVFTTIFGILSYVIIKPVIKSFRQ